MIWSKDKVAEAAKELAETLKIVDSIKELRAGQKELAEGLKNLGDRIRDFDHKIEQMRLEIKIDALKETHSVLHTHSNGINKRIEDLSVAVALQSIVTIEGKVHEPANVPKLGSAEAEKSDGP